MKLIETWGKMIQKSRELQLNFRKEVCKLHSTIYEGQVLADTDIE